MRGPKIDQTKRARSLCVGATSAENLLWAKLRNRGLNRYKFARQVAIGPYFADFCCREHKLIIEVDGATHSTDAEVAADVRRTAFLEAQGCVVMQVQNAEIFQDLAGVLETMLARLEDRDHL
jgi:very-short-patch-repair endonuclease